jgi:hypothetical protein|tara:strand:+ start:258 stop:854 length:597 start_codon:yes stop_codon:yes gene_type:complete
MLLLVTSAQLDHLNEMRTKEYEQTIEWAKVKDKEGYNVVWLETISNTEPSYLKGQFPCYCTDNHNPNYQNKGSNLGMAMRKFFDDCEVDDDYAIYLTGRYHFTKNTFFDIMEANPDCDFYGMNDGNDQYFTGCFAMKKKYMIDWLNKTNWHNVNTNMINFEQTLWDYVKENSLYTCEVEDMYMDCNVFGAGTPVRLTR